MNYYEEITTGSTISNDYTGNEFEVIESNETFNTDGTVNGTYKLNNGKELTRAEINKKYSFVCPVDFY